MGKSGNRHIESLKNVTLVVLFFTTMLLLYFFWGSPMTSRFMSTITGPEVMEIPTLQEITIPGKIIAHLGDGSYTVLENEEFNCWNECMDSFRMLSKDLVESVDEITEEQFDKIMDYESIFFRFFYSLPYDSLYKIYNVPEIHGFEQIGEFSLIALSSGSPESIFVYSSLKERYYRIVSKLENESMMEIIMEIQREKEPAYYPIGELIGTASKTIIPLANSSTRSELMYRQEFLDLDSQEVKEFAQTFFGESLDFVRQIRSSKGSRIYMYGYGDRILTIGAGGKVGYKNKESPLGYQQSYYEAMNTALNFVASHGGWQLDESIESKPFVLSVQAIESNKQKGFRFIFGIRLQEDRIYLEESHSIMVEVINGQVTQYLRDMIGIEEEEYSKKTQGESKETYSVINMIAQNYPYIAQVLTEKGYDFSGIEGEELFDTISNEISSVTTGYLKLAEEDENVLVPVWVISTDRLLIYFDLFDANPLGYADLREF